MGLKDILAIFDNEPPNKMRRIRETPVEQIQEELLEQIKKDKEHSGSLVEREKESSEICGT